MCSTVLRVFHKWLWKKVGRQISSLCADLKYPSGATNNFGQLQALRDVFGAGLLAIKILAGLRRVCGHRRVPVRPGGDQYGIDIFAIEEFTKIAIRIAALVSVFVIDCFLDERTASFLDVAHRSELHVFLFQEAT